MCQGTSPLISAPLLHLFQGSLMCNSTFSLCRFFFLFVLLSDIIISKWEKGEWRLRIFGNIQGLVWNIKSHFWIIALIYLRSYFGRDNCFFWTWPNHLFSYYFDPSYPFNISILIDVTSITVAYCYHAYEFWLIYTTHILYVLFFFY